VRDTVTYETRPDVDSGTVRVGVLAARDVAHDLALIRDRTASGHAIAGISFPSVGQNVEMMGHPLGLWWSYSRGQVSAIRLKAFGEGEAMYWIQTTAAVSPGNSGGGLFDDDGNLIGICHGYLPRGQGLSLFVHAKYLRDFLATANGNGASR
jgi:S1-C subfamily serine protease